MTKTNSMLCNTTMTTTGAIFMLLCWPASKYEIRQHSLCAMMWDVPTVPSAGNFVSYNQRLVGIRVELMSALAGNGKNLAKFLTLNLGFALNFSGFGSTKIRFGSDQWRRYHRSSPVILAETHGRTRALVRLCQWTHGRPTGRPRGPCVLASRRTGDFVFSTSK